MKPTRDAEFRPLVVAGALLLAAALLTSCGATPTATPTPTDVPSAVTATATVTPTIGVTPAPAATAVATQVAVITPASQAKAQSSRVWVGASGTSALSPLGTTWTALPALSRITTDSKGEGVIDLLNSCMLIYVYWDSQLVTSGCPKSGGVTCAIQGTSIYNNICAGQVQIDTLTANFTLLGTWAALTYNPASETSTVVVFSGSVRARPILNTDRQELGSPVTVGRGQFWFSAPDARLPSVSGLRPRQALPLSDLPPISNMLNVTPWSDKIRLQSFADRVGSTDFTVGLTQGPVLNLQAAGGAFAQSDRVQDAFLRSVAWADLSAVIYGGQNVPVNVERREQTLDARTLPLDVEGARRILVDMGYSRGFTATVVFRAGDERLAELARSMVGPLGQVGIQVNLDPQRSDSGAAEAMKAYAGAGLAAILLRAAPAVGGGSEPALLLSGGAALAEGAITLAMHQTVPWEELANSAFDGNSLPINTELQGRQVDIRTLRYDPATGEKTLRARYPNGFALTLMYPPDDKALAALAGKATDFLQRQRMRTTLRPVPPAEAMGAMRTIIDAGGNVLWFSR